MNTIITESLSVAMLTKVLIDIWRYYMKSQPAVVSGWVYPVMAVMVSIAVSLLLALANDVVITVPNIAKYVLIGILSAGQAIGVTELQKRG